MMQVLKITKTIQKRNCGLGTALLALGGWGLAGGVSMGRVCPFVPCTPALFPGSVTALGGCLELLAAAQVWVLLGVGHGTGAQVQKGSALGGLRVSLQPVPERRDGLGWKGP